jgi:acylphosphatase
MSEASTQTRTVQVLISGRVQGVWFRGWTQETARGLGLDGWVRNRRDGNVEAVFSGPSDSVARMLRLCGEGPPGAGVADVEIVQEGGEAPRGLEVRLPV